MIRWDDNSEHNREMMIDNIRCKREDSGQQPTQYVAPKAHQKWRARELFGFLWRHLGIKIPQGYRDVLLFLIEKANPDSGRVDWRQHKIANMLGLSRDYINEALKWWASETPYVKISRRKNKDGWYVSNAYHIRWKKIEEAWATIHAECNSTTDVDSDSTSDADSDSTTRNTKGKGQSGNPTLGVRQPSAVGTTSIHFYENHLLESQITTSPHAESQKGFQGEKVISLSANQRSAEARVKSYLGPFERRHVSAEAFEEAVAAELEVEGSGRAILSRAANEAWRQKRKA